jgi:hypothetical protein
MKSSRKWSNYSRQPTCWWEIQIVFGSDLIGPSNLPIGEKYNIFCKSDQIVIGDLPVGEKYKDFLEVVKLFHITSPLVKNTKISQVLGNLPVDEKYKDFLEVI